MTEDLACQGTPAVPDATATFLLGAPVHTPSATVATAIAWSIGGNGDVVLDGSYRVLRLLGEGSMGAVYLAENVRTWRRVAIKVMHTTWAQSDDCARRFRNEARAAARIQSDHVVGVLDAGVLPDGSPFIVMEYLEGETLHDRIARRPLAPVEAVAHFIELVEGLDAAHRAGIIHRDLKPENVFLARVGTAATPVVKILDFGVSKFVELADSAEATGTDVVLGSLLYMSPEQLTESRAVDARSDLYSVGAMMFEALTGRALFEAESQEELVEKILRHPRPSLESVLPSIDASLVAIVDSATSFEPERRFASARQFLDALVGWVRRVRSGDDIAPCSATPVGNTTMAIDADHVVTRKWLRGPTGTVVLERSDFLRCLTRI